MRVCVVLTARASYARGQTVLTALQADAGVDLQVVLAGPALLERYGDLRPVLAAEGIPVTAEVPLTLDGDSRHAMAAGTGLGVVALAQTFQALRPDTVVTIADRYETLATATAASYLGIRLVHLQGGEQTGSIDDKVRNAVTALADVHCVATAKAGERVRAMGARDVHVTGCPSIDLCRNLPPVPRDLPGTGAHVDPRQPFILVVLHPVVGEDDTAPGAVWEAVLGAGLPVLWFWPNVDPGSQGIAKALRTRRSARVRFVKNLPPRQFLALLQAAECLVGNSSVGIREASSLGTLALNLGTRQQGRQRGRNAVDVTMEDLTREMADWESIAPQRDAIYGDGHAGPRIAAIAAGRPVLAEVHG